MGVFAPHPAHLVGRPPKRTCYSAPAKLPDRKKTVLQAFRTTRLASHAVHNGRSQNCMIEVGRIIAKYSPAFLRNRQLIRRETSSPGQPPRSSVTAGAEQEPSAAGSVLRMHG